MNYFTPYIQVPTDVIGIFLKKNYYMVTDADPNMQCFADCFITQKKCVYVH